MEDRRVKTPEIRIRATDRCECKGFYSIVLYEKVKTVDEGDYYKFTAQCTNCGKMQSWLRKDRRICPISL